jgi:hypothetical protein
MLLQTYERRRTPRSGAGFTLAEVMIAVLCLAMFVAACFSCIVFNRVASMKAKEEGIAMDFLIHYVETVKALPFNEVVPGHAINPLLDGSDGAPDIRIPPDSSWITLANADFETFHPDLLWLRSRNPALQVLTTMDGAAHYTHLKTRMAWDAPLQRGGRLNVELDLVRIKDL